MTADSVDHVPDGPRSQDDEAKRRISPPAVYVTVLLIATAGLAYELIAGTLASYLLGDSVTQFSTVIGVYLTALGVGSWLSRFVERRIARVFIEIELAVALLGGFSAAILFLAFGRLTFFRPVLYLLVLALGILVGLEIPLLMRLLRSSVTFKELVAQVLTFDYLGALAASLLFPLLLAPKLGLVRTSLLFGLLNAFVALWTTSIFRSHLHRIGGLVIRGILVALALLIGFAAADRLTDLAEASLYAEEVIYAKDSPYQRIVLTRGRNGFQLFLNGNLQFASADEYRYHEALVHPAMASAPRRRRILVLGGGDGLALREILKWADVERVVLVDLDPVMTRLARESSLLAAQNGGAMASPLAKIVNADAMSWLAERPSDEAPFDVAIADFPDPSTFSVGKLYTVHFYKLLRRALAPSGVVAVQSTSPLFARDSFWTIDRTISAAGFTTRPLHVAVPSFGEWGFVLAARDAATFDSARDAPFTPRAPFPPGLRFLSEESVGPLFRFPPDLARTEGPVNRLNDQVLVRTYERELRAWQ